MLHSARQIIFAVVPVVHIRAARAAGHGDLEASGLKVDMPVGGDAAHEHLFAARHPVANGAPAHIAAHAPATQDRLSRHGLHAQPVAAKQPHCAGLQDLHPRGHRVASVHQHIAEDRLVPQRREQPTCKGAANTTSRKHSMPAFNPGAHLRSATICPTGTKLVWQLGSTVFGPHLCHVVGRQPPLRLPLAHGKCCVLHAHWLEDALPQQLVQGEARHDLQHAADHIQAHGVLPAVPWVEL
mmetsp:Transcript_120148/g.285474  ORF Transcript_120148/g.285474 Transcript_120148/m.285474 type:complete len:240 (+) Transcript_120148:232-951(+)